MRTGGAIIDRPGPFLFAAALLLIGFGASCSRGHPDPADLHATSPEVRASAVRKLVKATGDEFAALVTASEDPSAVVRLAAIEVLPTALHPRAVDILGDLLGDPSREVQAAAARAMGRCTSPKAEPHLVAAYARRGPYARAALIAALGARGVGPEKPIAEEARTLWDRNLEALQSASVAERVGAAEELGRSGRPEAVEKLKGLLSDSSVLLAAAAARGLGSAGDASVRPLLEPLLADQFPQLREAAADALGKLGDPAAGPALAAAAAGASPDALAAASALGKLAGSAPLACEAAGKARLAAAAQLLAREATTACDAAALADRLGGNDAAPALTAAAGLRTAAVVAPALKIALDPARATALRALALDAVAAAGGEAEASKVMELLTTLQERYRSGREEWVKGPLPDVFAPGFAPADAAPAQPLVAHAPLEPAHFELAPDMDPSTVPLLAAALEAAGRLHGAGSAPLLASLSTAPDPEVRSGAITGLSALGAFDAAVHAAIEDASEEVRLSAEEDLAAAGNGAGLAEVASKGKGPARDRALRTLGERNEATAAPALRAVFEKDAAPAAAFALGALHDKAAVHDLLAALAGDALAGRAEVIAALGSIGDASADDALAPELLHDRPEVRAAAATALAALHDGRSRAVLQALAAGDYYLEVRRAAAEALKELGPAQASR